MLFLLISFVRLLSLRKLEGQEQTGCEKLDWKLKKKGESRKLRCKNIFYLIHFLFFSCTSIMHYFIVWSPIFMMANECKPKILIKRAEQPSLDVVRARSHWHRFSHAISEWTTTKKSLLKMLKINRERGRVCTWKYAPSVQKKNNALDNWRTMFKNFSKI